MTWSFFRTVGASGLFLVALYASVQLIGEGQVGNFGTRRLREVKSRQLAIAECTDFHGSWQIAGVNAVTMVQTGSSFTVAFDAAPDMGSWTGEVTGDDCSGYIDFQDSGGQQTFSFSSSTGVMVFASGAEWTKPSESEVPAATPTPTVAATPTPTAVTGPVGVSATYSLGTVYSNAYCDTEDWETVINTATIVQAGSDNGVTNCAYRANNAASLHSEAGFTGPASGFIMYAAAVSERGAAPGAANYNCALCTSGVPVEIAESSWAVSFYLNDALNTPAPTPQEPTPEPTPLPPGATESPTPQPTIMPTNAPTLQPTPQPTLQPTPQPTVQPTLMPTMPGETYAPTPPPTPEPTYTPAPTTDVTGGAGWTMYDQTYCPVEWGQIWETSTVVLTEYECMERLEAAMQDDGTTMAAMVVTNVAEDEDGNTVFKCILCEDHASDLIDVDTLLSGQWFHMWVYNSAAGTPSPPETATPAPTPGHYPNHYVHSDASPCEENLTPKECEKLVQLYAHTPTIPGEAPFSEVNNMMIPTGCNFQPSGNILLYNNHQTGGGYDILPTGELMLMCKEEDLNARHVYIKNKHGLCLDAKDRRDRAGVVHMWPCDQMGKKDDTNKNQHWDYHKQTGQIKSHDGICLDASERSENGGQVWMWPCETNNKNQQWSYDPDTMQVMSRFGYCLDARQRKTRGGLVHMWKCMPGNKNQEWLFTNQIMDYESAMDYTENILEYGSWMGDDAIN